MKEQLAAQVASNEQTKTAFDGIKNEAAELCARPDLQPYYSKTACKPEDTTLEQMADKTRATNAEKIALNKVRTEVRRLTDETNALVRQYNPQNANAIIARREQAAAEQDALALDFYEGRITRGEFNRRRMEISKKLVNDLSNPAQRS